MPFGIADPPDDQTWFNTLLQKMMANKAGLPADQSIAQPPAGLNGNLYVSPEGTGTNTVPQGQLDFAAGRAIQPRDQQIGELAVQYNRTHGGAPTAPASAAVGPNFNDLLRLAGPPITTQSSVTNFAPPSWLGAQSALENSGFAATPQRIAMALHAMQGSYNPSPMLPLTPAYTDPSRAAALEALTRQQGAALGAGLNPWAQGMTPNAMAALAHANASLQDATTKAELAKNAVQSPREKALLELQHGVIDPMIARGASDAEIANATAKFWQTRPGLDTSKAKPAATGMDRIRELLGPDIFNLAAEKTKSLSSGEKVPPIDLATFMRQANDKFRGKWTPEQLRALQEYASTQWSPTAMNEYLGPPSTGDLISQIPRIFGTSANATAAQLGPEFRTRAEIQGLIKRLNAQR